MYSETITCPKCNCPLAHKGTGYVFRFGKLTIVNTFQCYSCVFEGKHAKRLFFRRLFYLLGIPER
jgi:hypothetical protein